MQCLQSSFYCHAHLHPNLTLCHCLRPNTNAFKLAGFASRFPHLHLTRSVAAKTRRKNRAEPEWQPEEEEEDDYGDDVDDEVDATDILLGDFDDPNKTKKRIEDRIKKKQKSIFQTKTGSAEPMNVTFNNFDFSDSYIWIEFERIPSDNDLRLISGAMRSWFVLGHLGGYNSSNMQVLELWVPLGWKFCHVVTGGRLDLAQKRLWAAIGVVGKKAMSQGSKVDPGVMSPFQPSRH